LLGYDSKTPLTVTSLPLISSFDRLRMSLADSYLINAKAIPEIMMSMRRSRFLTNKYIEDNTEIKTVEKGKYWNE
jgi:Ser/Thr protein kinase RdoA (MazF antagonist)